MRTDSKEHPYQERCTATASALMVKAYMMVEVDAPCLNRGNEPNKALDQFRNRID
jgi:hypothetical protein